jgi:HD-like signal output (HDOD) protein
LFENGTHFLEAENKILGINHTKVGRDLAARWSLPDSLIDTIQYHHDPVAAAHNIEVTHIVYLADLIMSRFHAGLELELLSTEGLSSKLKTIGFSIESFCDIVDSVPAGVFRLEPTPSFSG